MAERLFLDERNLIELGFSNPNIFTLRKLTEFVDALTRLDDAETSLGQKQPLDADLTAIAALATTAAGRSVLTFADPNSDKILFWDDSAGAVGLLEPAANLAITGTDLDASSSALVLITETVTSGSATSVSFTSIPATYRDLEVRIRGRGTTAATSTSVLMRFNNDSAANYDYETWQLNNATGTGLPQVGITQIYIGNIPAATATANFADYIGVTVADYRGTTFQKTGFKHAGLRRTSAVANLFTEFGSFWWRSTSAIDRVDVFPGAGAFVDGSIASLYGHL